MDQTIEEVTSGTEPRSTGDGSLRPVDAGRVWCRRRVQRVGGGVALLAVAAAPGRVLAAIDDAPPSNAGLPGGPLLATLLGWGKWVGLIVCALAIIYGAATWRGMGGNSGRGVEGKAYVGAGMLGAMIIGLAVIAVNTLYGAGQSGG
jgi:hypothetical protein